MQSSFEIMDGLWQVIEPALRSTISGGVYLNNEPHGDQKENIVINLLSNPLTYVQEATMNVNIHVMGINEHQADLARMKQIVDIVLPLLADTHHNTNGTDLHLSVEDDKGVFEDVDSKGKFFYNIRVKCITF